MTNNLLFYYEKSPVPSNLHGFGIGGEDRSIENAQLEEYEVLWKGLMEFPF